MYKTVCSSLCVVMLSATTHNAIAAMCEALANDRYHNPTQEDVSNLREMVNDAEEGLSELEQLVVRNSEDVAIAREATMKVAPLVALAGEPDEVGSMAARGYLSRRGVDWGPAVHKDVKDSINMQPHILNEPGESTPLLNDAVYATKEPWKIGAVGFKYAGYAFLAVGIGASVIHVYSADDHTEAAYEEGYSWAASLAAGETAGFACAATGVEVIVPLCVIIGGVLGGELGRVLGRSLFDNDHPPCYDQWTGVNNCTWTTRPPL